MLAALTAVTLNSCRRVRTCCRVFMAACSQGESRSLPARIANRPSLSINLLSEARVAERNFLIKATDQVPNHPSRKKSKMPNQLSLSGLGPLGLPVPMTGIQRKS
jgi:hypothetical protein